MAFSVKLRTTFFQRGAAMAAFTVPPDTVSDTPGRLGGGPQEPTASATATHVRLIVRTSPSRPQLGDLEDVVDQVDQPPFSTEIMVKTA